MASLPSTAKLAARSVVWLFASAFRRTSLPNAQKATGELMLAAVRVSCFENRFPRSLLTIRSIFPSCTEGLPLVAFKAHRFVVHLLRVYVSASIRPSCTWWLCAEQGSRLLGALWFRDQLLKCLWHRETGEEHSTAWQESHQDRECMLKTCWVTDRSKREPRHRRIVGH